MKTTTDVSTPYYSTMTTPPPPDIPETDLADWEHTDETVESLFSLPGVSVAGHTHVYERDQRFFFASRLSFQPPLPLSVETAIEPTVLSAAESQLEDRLLDRGATTVSFDDQQSVEINGIPGRAVTFESKHERGTIFEGQLAVTRPDGLRVAGGAYPADASDGRETLWRLIANVE
ncbi:MAG: hypothetical protein ACLFR6_03475 [Salinarchaeum sp.]